jgi:hypothetical protein
MSGTNDEERRAIEELLPWYAAGTLDRRDMRRVEEALAMDPELARTYALVREELGNTVHLNETLGAPSAKAMDKLFAKIDAEPARRPALSAALAERFTAFLAALSPRTLAWAASAAVVLILFQAGVIGGVLINQQTNFTTASAPAATAEGTFALVRFAPEATTADITALLEANEISIAEGPLPGGLYRLRAAGVAKQDLPKLIEQLKQEKSVGFIAPTE